MNESKDTLEVKWWQAYQPAATDEQISHVFFAKYGIEPEEIHRSKHIILAGPIPDRSVING